MASRSLSDLHPVAREKAMLWETSCRRAGVDVLIYCTYRSGAEQDALYAVGRTTKGANPTAKKPMGNTVTNAKAGESYHQWRCAWDAVPLVAGKPGWNRDDLYEIIAKEAEALGIEWAWRWKSFREKAHFQFTGGLTLADFKAGKTLLA